jgi:NUMOD3 motif
MIRINERLHYTEAEKQKLRKPKPWLKNNKHRVGKLHSEETKKKISESLIKRWSNKSERKNKSISMQGDNNHMTGKHHSLETKMKISQTIRAKKHGN